MGIKSLTPMEIDAIGEILNISLGASATAVSTMLDSRVDITTPIVRVVKKEEFTFDNLEPAVAVEITYVSGLEGKNVMLLKRDDVRTIVGMLMGTEIPPEDFELNEMNVSAICEVMNQMMGASATALSELLERSVNISTPISREIDSSEAFKDESFKDNDIMVVVHFMLSIADRMESEFINLMPIGLAKELVANFFTDGIPDDAEPEEAQTTEPEPAEPSNRPMSQEEIDRYRQMAAQPEPVPAAPAPAVQAAPVAANPASEIALQNALKEMEEMRQMMQELMQKQQEPRQPKQINVHPIPRPNISTSNTEEEDVNMDLVMGVPVEVSVEIGRTHKYVKDILELNKGSLVVLDKLAGEQVDLYVNGQCIAKGDVVVVDDNFGIRITEILKGEIQVS